MYLLYLAQAYASLGRHDDAIEVFQQVLKRSPKNVFAHIGLTSSFIASGREEKARHQAQELLQLDPAFSVDEFAQIGYIEAGGAAERVFSNLRKAGLK